MAVVTSYEAKVGLLFISGITKVFSCFAEALKAGSVLFPGLLVKETEAVTPQAPLARLLRAAPAAPAGPAAVSRVLGAEPQAPSGRADAQPSPRLPWLGHWASSPDPGLLSPGKRRDPPKQALTAEECIPGAPC